ncbi:MAG: polyamine ABC transporter substrate-binding protein [Rhodospirillaceae bacterium]|nr:MAG: polyamine ABC transporter substrate-binding protein [Rhodospirillaceae bacterium]
MTNRLFACKCLSLVLGFLLAALISVPAFATDKELNLYIWSDYLAPDTLANFTKATGIKVNVDVFDSSEMLEAKMLAGKSGYDVIVPNGPVLARLIKAGVVRPFDKTKLPHIDTQDPAITARAAEADPGNAYGIIYMWGTSGLGYNVAKVAKALGKDAAVDSWSLIFDPAKAAKLSKCGIYVFDSPSDVFEFTLSYMGKDPHSTNPADYEAAGALWEKVRPYITKFHNSEYISALANGDICLSTGFSGDVFQARDRAAEAKNGVEIGYGIPKEGAVMWFDFMAIPKDAPHADAAHAFIDYILRPEVIAPISDTVSYANANAKATSLIGKELREDKNVYPDAPTMKRLFPESSPSPEIERLRTRIWTRIKSGT